ncbi:hypothetical protein [Bacillus pumilus]|uniref:hypothetical protein n=1 Tax=Bacillus pumilus TaxID=1408 RepID=UPI0033378A8B
MHYPFKAGLILTPEQYRNGLTPAGGFSERDKMWVRTLYPPMNHGEQKDFVIKLNDTRKYTIATFGKSDSAIVLFEEGVDGVSYVAGDDDSGEDHNANINVELNKGKSYILRVHVYYSERQDEISVMYS